jgi:hypothetical protein
MMIRSSVLRHCVFLLQCYKSQGHNNEELGSLLSFFFCSSVGGPHGHNNKQLNSSSSHSFVLVLQLSQVHNEELDSSSSCFFCFSAISPRDTTTRSSALCHHVFFLFKCWRSPWARRREAQSSAQR